MRRRINTMKHFKVIFKAILFSGIFCMIRAADKTVTVKTIKCSIDNPSTNYHALEFTGYSDIDKTTYTFRWAQDGEHGSEQIKFYLSILMYAKQNTENVKICYDIGNGFDSPFVYKSIEIQ